MLSRPHPTLALRQSLDSAPGLPDTYDGEDTPSRSESRAEPGGCRVAADVRRWPPWGNGQLRYDHGRIASSCSQRQTATTAGYGWAKTLVWNAAFEGFLSTPDFTGELTRVAVPSLIVWGDKDTYTLRDSQERLRTVIPGARLVVYEGAGHGFHWEDPARFTADLAAFLTIVPNTTETTVQGGR
jgi:pimeloyl-ACP methyl ester carboxylesterase